MHFCHPVIQVLNGASQVKPYLCYWYRHKNTQYKMSVYILLKVAIFNYAFLQLHSTTVAAPSFDLQ